MEAAAAERKAQEQAEYLTVRSVSPFLRFIEFIVLLICISIVSWQWATRKFLEMELANAQAQVHEIAQENEALEEKFAQLSTRVPDSQELSQVRIQFSVNKQQKTAPLIFWKKSIGAWQIKTPKQGVSGILCTSGVSTRDEQCVHPPLEPSF